MAGAELMGFFALWVVVSAVAVAATALIVRGEISIRPAFNRRRWIEFLRQSIAYSIAAAVGLIYFRVAVVSISALSTDLEAGYYAAPFRIIETAANIPWMFVTSVFPILARAATRDTARLRYAVQRVTEVGLIVGVWMTLVLIVAAEPAIEVIGGLPEFAPSIPVLRLQALTLVQHVPGGDVVVAAALAPPAPDAADHQRARRRRGRDRRGAADPAAGGRGRRADHDRRRDVPGRRLHRRPAALAPGDHDHASAWCPSSSSPAVLGCAIVFSRCPTSSRP